MEISELQKKVDVFIQKCGGYWQPLSMLARLNEEAGEVSREVNILYGEKKSKSEKDHKKRLEDELADLIFTGIAMANSEGMNVEEVILKKMGLDYTKCKGVYFKE